MGACIGISRKSYKVRFYIYLISFNLNKNVNFIFYPGLYTFFFKEFTVQIGGFS